MGELSTMVKEDRREDNATEADAPPTHVDGKTEQELMNETPEAGNKTARPSAKPKS